MIIGIFSHFFALETTLAERQFFRALATLIGRRAARLSACGIAAIVSRMGYLEEGCSVGADGSLYNVSCSGFAELPFIERSSISRNILGLPTGFMRVYKISLERRESMSFLLTSFYTNPLIALFKRNIITHHAEDGSGVGSAIIAGKCSH